MVSNALTLHRLIFFKRRLSPMRNAIRMLPTYETIFFETVSKECETVCSEVHETFTAGNWHEYVKKEKETGQCKVVKSQGFSIPKVACVADVKKGRGRGNLGARERGGRSSLLPRAFSRALTPFLFPFERLPRTRRLYPRQESQSGFFILHQNETATALLKERPLLTWQVSR